jgi:hypothetical protein
MDRCNDCGSILPPDSECPVCAAEGSPSRSARDRTPDSDTVVRQSVSIEGSDVGGDITNDAGSKRESAYRTDRQSVTVRDSSIDGEIENRSRTRPVDVEKLVKTAVAQLESERTELEQETAAVDSDDLLAQLLGQADDSARVETLRGLVETENATAGRDTGPPSRTAFSEATSIPIAQTLSALTEVERLAASKNPELESLYVSIEKVVRLLSELEVPVSDELEAFVERQRALTEGSIYDETLDDPTRTTLQTLCDRARDTIVRTHAGGGTSE